MANNLKVGDRVYWWLAYGNRPRAKSCVVSEVKGNIVICKDVWGREYKKNQSRVTKNKKQ
jgi:hypothetical protein